MASAPCVLTTVFLVVLIADILVRGVPAFWQHSVVLDVAVDRSVISPDGKTDEATIRGADYFALTQAALEAEIPGIKGRAARKQLTRLLSSSAGDDLRDKLIADPS